MHTDAELLAFDRSRLADAEDLDEASLLERQGDPYRRDLALALWLDGWRERLEAHGIDSSDRKAGQSYVLREIVAHLRQGDFLPGGGLWSDISGESL